MATNVNFGTYTPPKEKNTGPYYYDINGKFLGRGTNEETDVRLAKLGETESGNDEFDPVDLDGKSISNFISLLNSHDDFLKIASIVKQETGDIKNKTGELKEEALYIAHTFYNKAKKNKEKYLSTITGGESSVGTASGDQDKIFGDQDNHEDVLAARAGVIHALGGGEDPTDNATQFDGNDFLAWGLTQGPYHNGKHAKFVEYTRIIIPQAILTSFENNLKILYPSGKCSWSGYGISNIPIEEDVFTDEKNLINGQFEYETGVKTPVNMITATAAKGESIFWKVEYDNQTHEKRLKEKEEARKKREEAQKKKHLKSKNRK